MKSVKFISQEFMGREEYGEQRDKNRFCGDVKIGLIICTFDVDYKFHFKLFFEFWWGNSFSNLV